MMKVKGMGHIAVNSGDFQKSIRFYRDILGLNEESTIVMEGFSITNLRLPDGGLLELFDYGKREDRAQSDNSAVGYRHFAFLTEDVDGWFEKLKENGVEIRMVPLEMPDLGIKGMLCLDPDGTEVELYEPLK
jgi:catechol 2,3-dioxygenase-like lactoylglutathione lyase family enzyme